MVSKLIGKNFSIRSASFALYAATALAVATASGMWLAACGNNNGNPAAAVVAVQSNPAVAGTLTSLEDALKASPGWQGQGCDAAYEGDVRQVMGVLDGRAAQIAVASQKAKQSLASSSGGKVQLLDLGASFLLRYNPPAVPKGLGWVTENQSWAAVIREFHRLGKTPTDGNWIALDRSVRTMLSNDQARLLYDQNMTLLPTDAAGMRDLVQAYESCLSDKTCVKPKLDAAATQIKDANPAYIALWQQLRDQTDPAQKRAIIQLSLKNRLRRDNDVFVAHADKSAVTRISGTDLQIALDPGTLVTSQAGLTNAASAIEALWSGNSLRLRVLWTSQTVPEGQGAFRLLVDTSPNEHATTFYKDRTIFVGPGRTDRDLAQEIGRAIGFGNHYFVVWNPSQCAYQKISNDLDLMSVPASGSVTSSEWQELDSLYPLPTTKTQ